MGTEPTTQPTTQPTNGEQNGAGSSTKPPKMAELLFKTNTAVIRVDGKKVEPNKVLTYAPGKVEVAWWCPPKRKREGSDIKRLKAGKKQVVEIRCKKTSR
jgi:hypothetical protein